jgi:hypothetical protein
LQVEYISNWTMGNYMIWKLLGYIQHLIVKIKNNNIVC